MPLRYDAHSGHGGNNLELWSQRSSIFVWIIWSHMHFTQYFWKKIPQSFMPTFSDCKDTKLCICFTIFCRTKIRDLIITKVIFSYTYQPDALGANIFLNILARKWVSYTKNIKPVFISPRIFFTKNMKMSSYHHESQVQVIQKIVKIVII